MIQGENPVFVRGFCEHRPAPLSTEATGCVHRLVCRKESSRDLLSCPLSGLSACIRRQTASWGSVLIFRDGQLKKEGLSRTLEKGPGQQKAHIFVGVLSGFRTAATNETDKQKLTDLTLNIFSATAENTQQS